MVGDTAKLPCRVKKFTIGEKLDRVKLVMWFRNGSETPYIKTIILYTHFTYRYFFLFQLFIRFLGEGDNNYRWYNLRQ